jgi:hypothetical protein
VPGKIRTTAGFTGCCREEMRNMPWYNDPSLTCRVLNRIARRYQDSSLQNLKLVLDNATKSIWRKQEQYENEATGNDRELG